MTDQATVMPPSLPPRRPRSGASQKPPVPPRPVVRAPSRRKPVPAHHDLSTSQSSASVLVPVASPDDDHANSVQPSPSLPPRSYQLKPELPPINHEKNDGVTAYSSPPRTPGRGHRQLGFVSRNQRNRRWWITGGIALLLIIIIVVVVAVVVSRKGSTPSTSSTPNNDNGGNPLSIEDGGVDIGQPGDIAHYGPGSSDHFVLQMNRSTLVSRFDPIVSPGQVSSHVHRFYGTSLVDEIRRNASEASSLGQCSTTPVQEDHSQYWVPQLYSRSAINGSLTMLPIRYHAAYYFQKAPTGQPIHPFPDNYNIVAGNPFRRQVDPEDMCVILIEST